MAAEHAFPFPRAAADPEEVEPLITPAEAAKLLGLPLNWVYRHAHPSAANPLPYVKLGKYTRFRESELAPWLRRHNAGDKTRGR